MADPQYVKLYLSNPDLIYADKFALPRHGQGVLIHSLKPLFRKLYGFDFDCVQYGKPELATFDYAESVILEKAQGHPISNIYMIGDNPEGDIEGANRKGWTSILVRSGVYRDFNINGRKMNDHGAKYIVDDMEAAVQLTMQLENIPNFLL